MKNIKTLSANVLAVTVQDLAPSNEAGDHCTYDFEVFEFSNGLVQVVGETTNDWFFQSIDEIEPNGTGIVEKIENTGRTVEIQSDELLKSIQGSIKEFGSDSVPSNHFELWK